MKYTIIVEDSQGLVKRMSCCETENNAFEDLFACGKLFNYLNNDAQEIIIPEGVTTLAKACFVEEDNVFCSCISNILALPASLETIASGAFFHTSFSEIKIDPGNTNFVVKDRGMYTADMKKLIYIVGKDELTEFYVPDGVKEIAADVMADDIELDADFMLHVPSSVEKIGVYYGNCYVTIDAPEGSYAARYADKHKVSLQALEDRKKEEQAAELSAYEAWFAKRG